MPKVGKLYKKVNMFTGDERIVLVIDIEEHKYPPADGYPEVGQPASRMYIKYLTLDGKISKCRRRSYHLSNYFKPLLES